MVRFSKVPRTFRARGHFGVVFGCVFQVSKKCFSTRSKATRYFGGSFQDSHIMRAKRSSRFFDLQAVSVK